MKQFMRRFFLFFLGTSSVVFVDQLSKFLVMRWWPSIMQLNRGISFGWLGGGEENSSRLILVGGALVIVFIFVLAVRSATFSKFWERYPLLIGTFWGGGVSNFFDRLLIGGVRDWLQVPFLPLLSPAWSIKNNVADWSIFGSLLLIILLIARDDFRDKTK